MGESIAVKIGSPTQPSPKLAMVMPSCVALKYVLRWEMMFRAVLARRFPLATSGSSCVPRTRTKANSAATKNPFNSTRPRTTRILTTTFTLQTHFSENHIQHILQTEYANFPFFASQNDAEPLAALLHPAQGDLQ